MLCLASGGGQDPVAFGMLGADVTVLDLSDVQLERDWQAAIQHGLKTKTIQGGMRDLSAFRDNHFDIVWQIYSINFVPTVELVFREVRRILKGGGIYVLQFANPFAIGIDDEKWDGKAFPLNNPYIDGEDLSERFPEWNVGQPDGSTVTCDSPHEFRHTLSTMLNSLVGNGFLLIGLWEWMKKRNQAHGHTIRRSFHLGSVHFGSWRSMFSIATNRNDALYIEKNVLLG